MKKLDVFSQWSPFDITKSKEEDGSLEIEGIASSESVDESGEIILQEGLDFSYALKRGVFNLEHLNGPKYVLGHPSKIYQTMVGNKKATAVKGILYTKKKEVQEIIETARAMKSAGGGRTLGFSIEGNVLERDKINPKIIKRARVLNISITSSPCNADATMKLVKSILENESNEVEETMEKHYEYSDVKMSYRQSKMLEEYSMKLCQLLGSLPDDADMPEWTQSKITKALDYLQAAYHYLSIEMGEQEVEARRQEMEEMKSYKMKYEKIMEEMEKIKEMEPTKEGPGIHPTHDEDDDYTTNDKPYGISKMDAIEYEMEISEEGSMAPLVEESLEDKMSSEDFDMSDEEIKELVMRVLREFPEISNDKVMEIIHQMIERKKSYQMKEKEEK